MGFNILAFETSWCKAFSINDYVLNGNGSPKKLIRNLQFWSWNTQEILELLLWLKLYNTKPGNKTKVEFYGFDIQMPSIAINNVVKYLKDVDIPASKFVKNKYSRF